MTSDYLKACVAAYLRYRRQCPIIAFERGISGSFDNPDVLAVTNSRFLIEVEVKVSLSDFRHDASKRKWQKPFAGRLCARQFYYAVPPEMVDKVQADWPHPDRGLLTLGHKITYGHLKEVIVMRPAKAASAKSLSTKQIVQLVHHQSGTLVSLARDKEALQARIKEMGRAILAQRPSPESH